MIRPLLLLPVLLLSTSCIIAVGNEAGVNMNSAPAADHGICVVRGTEGNESVQGVVHFVRQGDRVVIEAEFSGLTPGKHGFHIHEFGDVDCDTGVCTGGHYNPTGSDHGGPDSSVRHAGDLGNLVADENGNAVYRRVDSMVKLGGFHSVIGRAIIVHSGEDDLQTQPTGNAGSRVAYGVIGIAE